MPNYKNPNGYGSVVKLSGRRRKPFVVRKTVGYDDRAYPIYSVLGYYETRKDAMIALADFNRDPYNIDLSKATFKELYDLWSADAYPSMKSSLKGCYSAAYKHCSSLYDKEYRTLRKGHMQACVDESGKGYSTRTNIKLLFMQLDRYAFDHDIIRKCYSSNVDIGEKKQSQKHKLWTDEEVVKLWSMRGQPYIDDTLFLLYTGCRVSEMLRMKNKNINFNEGYMIGGIKTSYGTNRTIPIHSKLVPIIKEHASEKEFLFYYQDNQDNDNFSKAYVVKWKAAMQEYGFDHLTHDCRHTVQSKLDSAGANKVAIDRILGHSSKTIGEKIYTHKTVAELKDAIEKLIYSPVKA